MQRALRRVGSPGETPAASVAASPFFLSHSPFVLHAACNPAFLSRLVRRSSLLVTLGYLLAGKNSANWSVACSR